MPSTRNRRAGPGTTADSITTSNNTTSTRSLRSTHAATTINNTNNNNNALRRSSAIVINSDTESDDEHDHSNNKENDLPTPLTAKTNTITKTHSAASSSLPSSKSVAGLESTTSPMAARRRGTRPNNNTSTSKTHKTTRGGRRTVERNGRARSDSDSEVEAPRRERFEAVVIIERVSPSDLNTSKNNNRSIATIDNNTDAVPVKGVTNILELEDPVNDLNSASTARTVPTVMLDTSSSYQGPTSLVFNAQQLDIRQTEKQGQEDAEEQEDDMEDMISRLSLTPPPPTLFELLDDDYAPEDNNGDGLGTEVSPWLMHFDSTHSTAPSPMLARRSVPDLKVSDLDTSHIQSATSSPTAILRRGVRPIHGDSSRIDVDQPAVEDAGQHMDMNVDVEPEKEDDDDPFGFFKVERQLSKTRSLRPKLLAINERPNQNDDVRTSSPLGNRRNDSGDLDSGGSESLERVVMERAAARRRGGNNFHSSSAKDKGKAAVHVSGEQVDNLASRGPFSSLLDSDTVDEVVDADIEKAIRLSLNDLAGFEKTGESSSSSVRPGPMDVVGEESQLSVGEVAMPADKEADTALPKALRRVSRLYGRTHLTTESVAEDIPMAPEAPTAPTATSATNGARTNILEIDDLFSHPSTPPRKPMADRSLSLDYFRQSIGSDGLSPIVMETTPTKKPEAGMPSMYESPDSSRTGRGKKKAKKFMRTELLEAMLPRPRKGRTNAASLRLTRSSGQSGRGDNVFVIESDTDGDWDEEVEEDEDEEEEALVRRRHNRSTATSNKQPAKAATTTAKKPAVKSTTTITTKAGQKRQASGTTTAPVVSKRQRPLKSSAAAPPESNKSKSKSKKASTTTAEKEDKSQWTKEQWAAHEERIKYFAQVDDFELEVETTR